MQLELSTLESEFCELSDSSFELVRSSSSSSEETSPSEEEELEEEDEEEEEEEEDAEESSSSSFSPKLSIDGRLSGSGRLYL